MLYYLEGPCFSFTISTGKEEFLTIALICLNKTFCIFLSVLDNNFCLILQIFTLPVENC